MNDRSVKIYINLEDAVYATSTESDSWQVGFRCLPGIGFNIRNLGDLPLVVTNYFRENLFGQRGMNSLEEWLDNAKFAWEWSDESNDSIICMYVAESDSENV